MHGVFQVTSLIIIDRVARLVGTLEYAQASAAVPEHLRHKRHAFQAPILVESPQDLFLGAHLDPFAGAEVWGS
jgi:hypothetical protein